jgi:surfactin synthase thioesterase subunit
VKQILFKKTNISIPIRGKNRYCITSRFFRKQKNVAGICFRVQHEVSVITIDLLGHGDTECLGYIHSMEDNADAVHEVLSKLRIRKAIFVGHSMGGYVLAFAECIDTLKGLVYYVNSTAEPTARTKTNRSSY